MNQIRIGLDFGTHQTKICVQRTPDEGHGEPQYEFFRFKDLNGGESYFLPSVIQINADDTLSYGFVDASNRKQQTDRPMLDTSYMNDHEAEFDMKERVEALFKEYSTNSNDPSDKEVIWHMLAKLKEKLKQRRDEKEKEARQRYANEMLEYRRNTNFFRYFKQATFSTRYWDMKIPSAILTIWYLSYVLFLLEEKYGENFSINMGIPTDSDDYQRKSKLAVEILLTVYTLVEKVYHSDINLFLKEKVDRLITITREHYQRFSQEQKENNVINIFPEAYAGLIPLTSKGKLATGMSITADIGGGTTDVSFFTIENGSPIIYRYWSLPYGLNYIAEQSGFDYQDEDMAKNALPGVIKRFNDEKEKVVRELIKDLVKQFQERDSNVLISTLYSVLKDRIVVYNGGGSTYPFLTTEIDTFTDVKVITSELWKEEHIKYKKDVGLHSKLLTTAYGLSLSESDQDVKIKPFTSLFNMLQKRKPYGREPISKDQV